MIEKRLRMNCDVSSFTTTLLNSVLFIFLFGSFDHMNDNFKAAIHEYEEAKKLTQRFRLSSIHDVINTISRRPIELSKKMIVDCSTVESEKEMGGGGGETKTVFYTDVSQVDMAVEGTMVDFPFAFTALLNMAQTDISSVIYNELLKQLDATVCISLSRSY